MAYADFGGKIILHSWGRFRLTMAEAGIAGDLVTKGGALADAEDSKAADAILCEDIAINKTGWAALAVEIKKPPTVATGGGVTAATHGATAGTVLYLDGSAEQGKAIEAAGTISQEVGWALSTDRVLLIAMHVLSGTNATFSGTLAVTGAASFAGGIACDTNKFTVADTSGNTLVAGTLAVTGVPTFTAEIVSNGGIQCAAEKGIGFTAKDYTGDGAIATKGLVTLSADAADLAMTLAAPAAGDLLVILDLANSGTKNHVVSAKAASATFDGTNNTATFNATQECLVLLGTAVTRWHIVENIDTVGLSST